MNRLKTNRLQISLLMSAAALIILFGPVAGQQPTLNQLEAKLTKQYKKIYDLFAQGPAGRVFPLNPRDRVRRWQDDLADSFAAAEVTIGQILKLHPADEEHWHERRDTMRLYSTPTSPPETRTVFGKTEVEKQARLIEPPAAKYPDSARAAKAKGEVRLRLVLAADGAVKYIFPMKPLKHGLTEAAIEAAKQIKFEPAIRNGSRASQFLTIAYEFKNGQGLKPYVPEHEFYF
jgi:TonB family protein